MTKSEIFKAAWDMARNAAVKFGGSVKSYFAISLSLIYKGFKNMYEIQSSYCGAFKDEKELNSVIAKYVETKKVNKWGAVDVVKSYTKQMNTEGVNDLYDALNDAIKNDFKFA